MLDINPQKVLQFCLTTTRLEYDKIDFPFGDNKLNFDRDDYDEIELSIESIVINYCDNGKNKNIFNRFKNIFIFSPKSASSLIKIK